MINDEIFLQIYEKNVIATNNTFNDSKNIYFAQSIMGI